MASDNLVAVFVVGGKNLTRVTRALPLNDKNLNYLSARVMEKEPGRVYYVMRVENRLWKKRPNHDPLYVWHVGEGFQHKEGWWVDYE